MRASASSPPLQMGAQLVFDFDNGRSLALDMQRPFIGIFVERFPGDGVLPGVKLRVNGRTPGQYGVDTPRGHRLKVHKRLGLGNEIFYLECEGETALDRFVDRYESA